MDLKELRAFCSVAAGGGFSRAAAALAESEQLVVEASGMREVRSAASILASFQVGPSR